MYFHGLWFRQESDLFTFSSEENPAIGNRALRLGFTTNSLLKPQIRSFLRLSKIFKIKCPMARRFNSS